MEKRSYSKKQLNGKKGKGVDRLAMPCTSPSVNPRYKGSVCTGFNVCKRTDASRRKYVYGWFVIWVTSKQDRR